VTQRLFGYDARMSEQQPAGASASPDSSEETAPDDSGSSQLPESEPGDIGDDQLPEDLRPTEDNPLARHPAQTGEDDDMIGSDTEGGDAQDPSTNITYGSGPDDNDVEDTPDAEEDDGSSTLENGGGGAG
jgi:hypothetical protein